MKVSTLTASPNGYCAFCREFGTLCMSHAIPKSAFKALMASGSGKAIGIPKSDRNAYLTSDTGDGPLLCKKCEGEFNRNFDGPMTNALKQLDKEIIEGTLNFRVNFEADKMAHAIVATAWRICLSPANMYREVNITAKHMAELDELMRKPTSEILKHCSVKISRLKDRTSDSDGGFEQALMRQFIKTPEVYSIKIKRNGRLDRFAIDWTMFGFLIHLIVPKIPYPKSRNFGGLKVGSGEVVATPTNILDYGPLRDALVAGFAKQDEGKLSPALKKRSNKPRV